MTSDLDDYIQQGREAATGQNKDQSGAGRKHALQILTRELELGCHDLLLQLPPTLVVEGRSAG